MEIVIASNSYCSGLIGNIIAFYSYLSENMSKAMIWSRWFGFGDNSNNFFDLENPILNRILAQILCLYDYLLDDVTSYWWKGSKYLEYVYRIRKCTMT